MRRSLVILAVLAVAAAVTPAGANHDPAFNTPEWIARDLDNQEQSTRRLQDQYTNPAYHAKFQAKTHQTWHTAIGEQLEEPTRPRLTVGQWAPGGQTGDPFRIDWEEMGRGAMRPVSFLNRHGAKLEGHLWMPNSAAPGSLPGIVITTGSIQAPESVYWWAAQGLAEAGYMVLTYDVQGQGRSETFGHGPNGMFTCPPDACPSQNLQNFIQGTIDALDLLTSSPANPYTHQATHNPWHTYLDRSRLGAAGHSLGASAVTWVQDIVNRGASNPESAKFLDRGIALNVVDTVVGWDNLSGDTGITPRVPAMGQNGEYFLNPMPGQFLNCGSFSPCAPGAPNPEGKRGAFNRWKAAGIDTMQFAFRNSTHLEWSFVPYILPASHWGERIAVHYTLAWFDRYLKGDTSATSRLTATVFDGSADASAVGAGYYDPATGENVPWTIAGKGVADNSSIYFKSGYRLNGGALSCDDMRHGC